MTNKPILYVPDYVPYAEPFRNMFDVITSDKPYDLEVARIADVLMLTGGSDINPEYYGQKPHPSTHYGEYRDKAEHKLIQQALDRSQPILGICRGAEWLAIVAGGKLFQDVSHHQYGHGIKWGKIDFTIHATSIHHQMCDLREVKDAKILAYADGLSNCYEGEIQGVDVIPPHSYKEPEVFTIESIKGFGIQGHPEMSSDDSHFNVLCRYALAKFLAIDPDKEDATKVDSLIKTQKEIKGHD